MEKAQKFIIKRIGNNVIIHTMIDGIWSPGINISKNLTGDFYIQLEPELADWDNALSDAYKAAQIKVPVSIDWYNQADFDRAEINYMKDNFFLIKKPKSDK